MGKTVPPSDAEYSGIFALEGDWNPEDLTEGWSVRPNLETLRDMLGIDFIHRRVGTRDEFRYYVEKWLAKGKGNYRDFKVGYFAFHGYPGTLCPGEGDVRLYQLERWMDGGAKGRVVFFDACSTLDINNRRIKEFVDRTKVSAVVGYAKDVDSLESMALDLLILWALTGHEPCEAEELLWADYGGLAERLGLTFVMP